MSKKNTRGILGSIKDQVFGKGDRTEDVSAIERVGIKWTLDWHLATRLDKMQSSMEAINTETSPDKKLILHKLFLDWMSFYGEPGDNVVFFKKNLAWQRLYGYYRIGKAKGFLSDDQMKVDAEMLHVLANATISASMYAKHIMPNTPIVIQAQPSPGNKWGGWSNEGGDNPTDNI